jgi:NAD(P)-dependent dehydrogenase (short-subunit alcohol dehydrogenase family)/acyl carrier protein
MGAGIEDVVAVKSLETGCIPPVANFKEVDPELGSLNLSRGGSYPVEYALRLGAGFGSQISMSLLRWVATKDGVRPSPHALGYTNRILDPQVWSTWLTSVAGHEAANLEVIQRTLRVKVGQASARQTPDLQVRSEPAPEPKPAPPITDSIKEAVLALVAQKTGYPPDMLALDLDLEADLGVDTVKQAEIFAAIRETYNIHRDQNLKLRDFPTLAHVIQFVRDRRPDVVQPTPSVEPVAPTAAPHVPTPTAAPRPSPVDGIQERVLAIVAEKTGYPKEMLDLDLDLEADLGIDTVKQAEMFAAIREAYNIPRDPNLKLRDFPTLAHVIRFAYQGQSVAPPAAAPTDTIKDKVLDIVAQKTGYPKEMLDLDLDLEADLGIDTVKQAEMFAAIREAYNIPRDPNLKLRDFPTLAHVIQFAQDGHAGPASSPVPEPATPVLATFDTANRVPRRVPIPVPRPALTVCKSTGVKLGPGSRVVVVPDQGGVGESLTLRLITLGVEVLTLEGAQAPVHGVYWLPALDDADPHVKSLYATMRSLFDQNSFLVSATRLGGQHGYDTAGALAPLGGAITGFTKAYKRERPDALVKAVDFAVADPATYIAELLLEETLRDPGTVEIGYKGGQRWTIALEEQPFGGAGFSLPLDKNTIFVITGAAGSIVSAITADLATASGGTFYLLDLAPKPDPNNPDLDRFVHDREALKRDLFARIQARGERATPALVEKELAALERVHAARAAIDAVRAAGGQAHYFSLDLRDDDAVKRAIDEVRQRHGRVDVLLHAAGMERSHFLPDKDPKEFDLVFDVKVDGWFNLLRAIGDMPLGATVAFSSIAGRFGNGGQTDYSAANDLLCKIASNFRTTRPATRAIAIDWTAWAGIGMASRGSIPKMMEAAGIDMLPPEAGIPWIRRELTEGSTRGEIVVAQSLGILTQEFDSNGGVDPAAWDQRHHGPMIGSVTGMGVHHGLSIETPLDPKQQPFLYDHQIDGTPVLPGVMGIEGFAEATLCALPGWHIDAVEDVDFLAPFKFYRGEPRSLKIEAEFRADGDQLVAACRLIGHRTLPNQTEPQLTTHFTARVRLSKHPPAPSVGRSPRPAESQIISQPQIYSVYFHGPAYQVVAGAWWEEDRMVGQFVADLPPNHQPAERPLAIAPRLIELCFQTAGLFEMSAHGRMGLPQHVDKIQLLRMPDPAAGPLYCVVKAGPSDSMDADVVDGAGNCYLQVIGYRTVVFREEISAEPLRALAHATA